MAFSKSLPTDFGIAATYWRIIGCQHDILSGNGTIYLAGYVSPEARAAGNKPISNGTVPYENGSFSMDDDREAIYKKLKAMGAPWDNAEDV